MALAEGEGCGSAADWQAGHEAFWTSSEVRVELGDPEFVPDDDERVVVTWYAVVERLG